jgi:hypothetical protein
MFDFRQKQALRLTTAKKIKGNSIEGGKKKGNSFQNSLF